MTDAPERPARLGRKREILEIFARLVAERGYDLVSIREVAEELGMSKGTILHHYGSKDRILEQVHRDYMTRRLAEVQSLMDRLNGPAEQLAGMILQNLFAMHHDHDAMVAFAREIVRFAREETMREVRKMRRAYQDIMVDILARGMDDGVFRRGDASMLALQIFGMTNWSWTWMDVDGPWTLERIGESFVQLVLNGVGGDTFGEVTAALPEIMELVEAVIEDSRREFVESAS